jgi:hypothetical protein
MVCSKNLGAQILTATTKTNIRVIREIRAKNPSSRPLRLRGSITTNRYLNGVSSTGAKLFEDSMILQ